MAHVQNVPKNLNMGLTLTGDQYFPAPNYRTYFGDSTKPLNYFNEVGKGAYGEKKFEEEIQVTKQKIQEKYLELLKFNDEHVKRESTLIKSEGNLKLLKQSQRKIEIELSHLKDIEESRPITITKMVLGEEVQKKEI